MGATDSRDWLKKESFQYTKDVNKVYDFGTFVLMLKNDGKIYGKGNNENYLLGTSEPNHNNVLNDITAKNSEAFKDFTTNGRHALAISKNGFLFSWGENAKGELGHKCSLYNPQQVLKTLGIRVSKIACGLNFSFILTMEGKLYEWGTNGFKRYGLNFSDEYFLLKKIKKDFTDDAIEFIMCTIYYPVVVTTNGKIFIPNFPRIKTDNDTVQHEKLKEFGGPLKGKTVIQVVCGKSFVFALTRKGQIFKWILSPDSANEPELIESKIERRVVKIMAATSVDILVATDDHARHISLCWIIPGVESISYLNLTPEKYFDCINVLVYGPIYDLESPSFNIEGPAEALENWRNKFILGFNKKECCDITFYVEKEIIYAHKAIISLQCPYLKAMLTNDRYENSENGVVTVKGYSYETYLRFLQYLYSAKLEISSHESNLELLKLAHEYDEKLLLNICMRQAINGLTVENVLSTYKLACHMDMEDLQKASKLFMITNYEAFFFSEEIETLEKLHIQKTILKDIKLLYTSENK